MQLLEAVWKRPLLAAATAGCLLGCIIGALWPLPPADASGIEDGPLPLPARAAMQRYAEADFAKLRDGRLWTGSAAGQDRSARVSSWRLLGVVTRPAPAALVEANRKQVSVAVGQALPDGTILRSVNSEAIEFERDNCPFQRSLYSVEDVPVATPDCPATNAANPKTRANPSE
jgi:hypothetical protein